MSVKIYTARNLTPEQETAKAKIIIKMQNFVDEARVTADVGRFRMRHIVAEMRRKRR